ncbi:10453_t:CDS:2 [Diversispora eburnea]|uniref:10453_t:CDS:1 n=1 Tax=Diversispora eburnea TaxID=1213867 RepID=A0A9N9FSP6_9GLOM|nr:10453_t:CDS:2 [Diversispora eburnea]
MFNKSQITSNLPHYYRRRFLSRRNNLIRLTLVALLLLSLYFTILKPWVKWRDSRIISKIDSSTKNDASKTDASWKINLNETINSRFSVFNKEQFTVEALKTNGLIPVTAVLIGWKRKESLQIVVNFISKYPFIKEILIWNNNDKIRLHKQDFRLNNTEVKLNIFNSDENLHDLSKYITCTMAKYDYCYFQDDDWLNLYMDSIYTNFLKYPNLIHSNTMPIIHLEHRRWMFASNDKNLHTGFTWLGCGSFIPRIKVQRFLGQIGSASLEKERLRLVDMYFSLWTNQYPYQLSNPLTTLDQSEDWSKSADQWTLDAVQKLYTALAVNTGSELFERQEENPHYLDRDVSICYANNITHIHEHEAEFNALDFPSNEFWIKHAYHKAVDFDLSTCWNSFKKPKVDDYFGLQFVEPQNSHKITIVSSKDRICDKISSSEKMKDINSSIIPPNHSITINFNCEIKNENLENPENLEALENMEYRYIKFQIVRNFTEPFEICSLILDGLSV